MKFKKYKVEKIIKALTYAALATPLVYLPGFYRGFTIPEVSFFFAVVGLLFFLWVYAVLTKGKYKPDFNLIAGLLSLYIVVYFLASILGVDPLNSLFGGYSRFTGFIFIFHLYLFFLVLNSTLKKDDWPSFFQFSVSVSVIIAGISIVENMGLDPPFPGNYGTISLSSFLGTYLLFNTFFALYLFFKLKDVDRYLFLIAVFFLPIPVWLVNSRAAFGSIIGGLLLFGVLFLIFKSKKEFIQKLGVGALVLGIFVGTFLAVLIFHPAEDNLVFNSGIGFKIETFLREDFNERTEGRRHIFWNQAMRGFRERPVLGYGPNNFEYVYYKHYNPTLELTHSRRGGIKADRAHNIIYEKLATQGIIGFLVFFTTILFLIFSLWRKKDEKIIDFYESAIFSSLLVAWFVQNLTVFDTVNSYIMLFFVFGFVASEREKFVDNNSEKCTSLKKLIMMPLLLILILSIYFLSYKPLKTSLYIQGAITVNDPEKIIEYSEKAYESSPFNKEEVQYSLGAYNKYFLEKKLKSEEEERFVEVIEHIIEIMEKDSGQPLNFNNQYTLSHYYLMNEQPKKAARVAKKAIEISPKSQRGYWQLARIKSEKGDYQKALKLIDETIKLEEGLIYSYKLGIEIARENGDWRSVQKYKEWAIKNNPDKVVEIYFITYPEKRMNHIYKSFFEILPQQ